MTSEFHALLRGRAFARMLVRIRRTKMLVARLESHGAYGLPNSLFARGVGFGPRPKAGELLRMWPRTPPQPQHSPSPRAWRWRLRRRLAEHVQQDRREA
jgi:hypothetical protein